MGTTSKVSILSPNDILLPLVAKMKSVFALSFFLLCLIASSFGGDESEEKADEAFDQLILELRDALEAKQEEIENSIEERDALLARQDEVEQYIEESKRVNDRNDEGLEIGVGEGAEEQIAEKSVEDR